MRVRIEGLVMPLLFSVITTGCEGPTGPAGADGADGIDGQDGQNGQDGQDGQDGEDGQDGLNGVDGQNGLDGQDGQDGEDGEDLFGEPEALTVEITSVTTLGPPVVSFTVVDQDGNPFSGLTQSLLSSRNLRFALAKLVPGANGDPDAWQSYINTTENTSTSTAGPGGVPVLATATQATAETTGTLASVAPGEYTYTFKADITAITTPIAVSYDPDYLHRVAIQIEYPLSDGTELIYNPTFDWVPSGLPAPATRDMVMNDSCNECHGELALHGGGRVDMKYCVTCHNPGTTDANSGNSVDMSWMVHKIHMGHELTEPYIIWGFGGSEHDYSHVGYPQDQRNCIKCHNPADAETPDAINFLERPSIEACGSCHDTVDFAAGDGHAVQADNSACFVCHPATGFGLGQSVEDAHLTDYSTPNNPGVPDGYINITYEVLSASVDVNNDLTVEFVINADGSPLDLNNLPSELTAAARYPTFDLFYALPQGGIDAPDDFNNAAGSEAAPITVGMLDLINGVKGTVSYSGGVNTAVISSGSAFPVGSVLRAVAIEGYFNQTLPDLTVSGRHAVAAYATVTGDAERRNIVDDAKCSNCHEWFEGHGGNRVVTTRVCAGCHNPNLTSSGRELDLTHPEESNNLGYMIHGIHGASVRSEPLDFVRNRSGGLRYTFITADQLDEYPDGTVVSYPTNIADCTVCHLDGTYMPESVPANALPTTSFITDGTDATTVDVVNVRATVPNPTDWVISATAAACGGCHNGNAEISHMELEGAVWQWDRLEFEDNAPFEACVVCHDAGSTVDAAAAHGL